MGKKLACAICPGNPLMWVSNSLSSIQQYREWRKLCFLKVSIVRRSENILVKIVFDQICLHSFFILRFVCNQPGNDRPVQPQQKKHRFLGEELGRKVLIPDVLGQIPCKLDKVKITRSKPLESLAHLFNEFFFVEDFGNLRSRPLCNGQGSGFRVSYPLGFRCKIIDRF